jgi:hypothetical protein
MFYEEKSPVIEVPVDIRSPYVGAPYTSHPSASGKS